MFTIGFGNLMPVTEIEIIFYLIVMLISYFLLAFTMNKIRLIHAAIYK